MKQTYPILLRRGTSLPLCALALLTLPIAAIGQESESQDDIFELSPFVVDGTKDSGYRASNTLAGTRLNSEMRDVAASVTGYTEQFLQDIGATDLESILAYSPSAERDIGDNSQNPSGNDNVDSKPAANFRVRGLSTDRSQNFFRYNMPIDVYNLGRLDESRGPNSLLFGIGEAGGIINGTTKKASFGRDSAHLQLRYGSDNFRRGSIDINQVLIDDKLAIRANFLVEDSDDWRFHLGEEDKRAHIASTFRVNENTTLRAEYESVSLDDVVGRAYQVTDDFSQWDGVPQAPNWAATNNGTNRDQWWGAHVLRYVGNDQTTVDTWRQMRTDNWFYEAADYYNGNYTTWWREANRATSVANNIPAEIVTSGPGAQRSLDLETITAYYEQKIGDSLFFELAARHQDSEWISHWSGSHTIRRDPNANRANGTENPYLGQYYVEGGWDRRTRDITEDTIRATASYQLDLENSRHNFAAMYSFSDENPEFKNEALYIVNDEIVRGNANPVAGLFRGTFRQYFTSLDNPESVHIPSWETIMNSTVVGRGALDLVPARFDWLQHHSAQNDDTVETTSMLLAAQSFWFNDRLVTTLGIRQDDVEYTSHDVVRPSGEDYEIDYSSRFTQSFDSPTYTAGVVYHATEQFSLFYNQSSNIGYPNFLIDVLPAELSPDGRIQSVTPDPTEGDGWDAGVMFTLFEGKIDGRFTLYEAENTGLENWSYGWNTTSSRVGALLSNIGPNGIGIIDQDTVDLRTIDTNGTLMDDKSDGYELTLTGNLSENLRLQFNISRTNRERFNTFADADRLLANYRDWFVALPGTTNGLQTEIQAPAGNSTTGLTAEEFFNEWQTDINAVRIGEEIGRGLRKDKLNLYATYDFKDGGLKGFSAGGGVRYQSANLVGVDANNNILKGEALEYVDFHIAYKFKEKLFGKAKADIRLNVRNAFDQDGLIPVRFATIPIQGAAFPNERNAFADPNLVDAATFHEPRSVALTLNLRM